MFFDRLDGFCSFPSKSQICPPDLRPEALTSLGSQLIETEDFFTYRKLSIQKYFLKEVKRPPNTWMALIDTVLFDFQFPNRNQGLDY